MIIKNQKLIVFAILSFFVCMASLYLNSPGLQTDEVLFANLALGEINQKTYIGRKIFGITFFVVSYIGALKSWLYMPIFSIFGFNYFSVRLPMILLSALSLGVVYKYLKLSISSVPLVLAILALIATEPTFIAMTRTDVGPIVLEYLLKSIAIYLIFNFIKTHNYYYLLLVPIPLCLGVFNKLNFVWFSNALIGASVFLIPLLKTKELKKNFLKAIAAIFVINVMFFLGLNRINPSQVSGNVGLDLESMVQKTKLFYFYWKGIFDGRGFFEIQYAPDIYDELWNFSKFDFLFELSFCILLIGFLYTIFNIILQKTEVQHYTFLFFVFIVLFISFQVFIVKNATNLWHYYTVFPFYTICLALSLNILLPKSKKWVMFSFLTLLVMYNVANYRKYLYAFKSKIPKAVWSNQITNLAEYTKPIKGDFIEIDWGLNSQLVCLTQQNKFTSGFMTPLGYYLHTEKNPSEMFFESYVKNKNLATTYFILSHYRNKNTVMIDIFNKMQKDNGFIQEIIKDFYEKDSSLQYRIIRLKKDQKVVTV